MTELVISADEVEAALARHVANYTPAVVAEQVGPCRRGGRRHRPGDRVCPDASVNELLEFEDGTVGLALNLDEDTIGAVDPR